MATIVSAVGAAGNWTVGTTWIGGVAPTAADDAQIPLATTSITIDSGAVCRSADFSTFTGVCTHNASATLTIGDGTAGLGNVALTLVSGMTYTLGDNATSAISFVSTSTTQQTVTTGGKLCGNVTFVGVGGSWLLSDSLTLGAANVTLTSGILNTNGQTVTTASTFNISGNLTRTLTLGASSVSCDIWTATTTTNLTFNVNTSTITHTSGNNFGGGGLTYNNVVLNPFTSTILMNGANTFANLTLNGISTRTSGVSFSANQVITGTLTLTGNSLINRLLIRSDTLGTARTLTAAAVSLSNCDFQDITAAGAASPFTGTSIGNALGNTNITPTAAVTRYWVGGTGNWSDTAEWSDSSGGAGGSSVPLCHDTVVFDANSFSAGSQTVTADMSRLGAGIDFTGVTNSPIWSRSSANTIFGSLTLASSMTYSSGQVLTFQGRSSLTLTSAGVVFGAHAFNIEMVGGTLTLQDSLANSGSTGTLTISNGVFNANGFNVTFSDIASSNANTRTVTMGSGTWSCTTAGTTWSFATTTGLTFSTNTSTIRFTDNSASNKTFAGGGLTYNNFHFAPSTGTGSLTISGSNTFNEFKDDGSATHSILFTVSTTQTIAKWSVRGNNGNNITINSTTTGTHTLTRTGAEIFSSNFLNIQHSVATPANVWYAGVNSVNNQGVATAGSGWIFTGLPGPALISQKSKVIRPYPFSPGLAR